MKVTNDNLTNIQTTKTGHAKNIKDRVTLDSKSSPSSQTGIGSDVNVTLSDKAKHIARAHQIASNTPDVRQNKVEKLKELIRSGKYQVDAAAVADKMVDEHLMDV